MSPYNDFILPLYIIVQACADKAVHGIITSDRYAWPIKTYNLYYSRPCQAPTCRSTIGQFLIVSIY